MKMNIKQESWTLSCLLFFLHTQFVAILMLLRSLAVHVIWSGALRRRRFQCKAGVTVEGSALSLLIFPTFTSFRHHLISLGVAVDILGCTGTVSQRATVLHKLILLARALKEHVHNLYSFSAVMKALEMPQVGSISQTHVHAMQNECSFPPHVAYAACADHATGDDVAGAAAKPHRECCFI